MSRLVAISTPRNPRPQQQSKLKAMHPAMLRALLLSALLLAAECWDSRDIPESEWACTSSPSVVFAGAPLPAISCGTEILQPIAQKQPTVTFPVAPADASTRFTVIIVDRDAPNSSVPLRSPIRHFAAVDISSTDLASGFAGPGAQSFAGPQPPVSALLPCHRYYTMVYAQLPGVVPETASFGSGRYLWDFRTWATANNLTKLGVNYWTTQNYTFRAGPCAPPAAPSSVLTTGELAAIIVGGIVVFGAVAWGGLRYSRRISADNHQSQYFDIPSS
jgi:phosphatidylethanolamine-binding protein (PEBP) family uncharacterized protein